MGVKGRCAGLVAAQLVLLGFCGNAVGSPACPGDDVQPAAATAATTAQALLCDLNNIRARNGLGGLKWDWRLWAAAQKHAEDMAGREYFAHITPEGLALRDRVAPTGYLTSDTDWTLAENLGFGTNTLSPPAAITDGWMDSAPHRENMLDPTVEDVGIGLAQGAVTDGGVVGTIYVVDFGARQVDLTQPRAAVVRTTTPVRRAQRRRYRSARWARWCSKAMKSSALRARRITKKRCVR
ncbi:MAG TPA: CAP domain-containing protein [Thermoleophilaceae bacterium]|nr:CAP domain-containing protein [Thermoleophilaceae bacterium]